MATLLFDDFDGTLTVDGNPWGETSPPLDYLGGGVPYFSGGTLHLVAPAPALFAHDTHIASTLSYPLRCTEWVCNLDDVPTGTITASTDDFFDFSFGVQGSSGTFVWLMRYHPPDVEPSVGTAGTDTTVRLYPAGFVTFPPVADNFFDGTLDGITEYDFDISLHKYLRVKEECHTVTWSYSADGSSWTDAFTYDLDPQFSYVDSIDAVQEWSCSVGLHVALDNAYEVLVESVTGTLNEDCPCKGGWRLGGPKSGQEPW